MRFDIVILFDKHYFSEKFKSLEPDVMLN